MNNVADENIYGDYGANIINYIILLIISYHVYGYVYWTRFSKAMGNTGFTWNHSLVIELVVDELRYVAIEIYLLYSCVHISNNYVKNMTSYAFKKCISLQWLLWIINKKRSIVISFESCSDKMFSYHYHIFINENTLIFRGDQH